MRLFWPSSGLRSSCEQDATAATTAVAMASRVWNTRADPMTRYLAAEFGPRGIRVNMLAPGATATDFSGGVIRDDPDYRRRVGEITALGRPANPQEIGPIVATLLSDEMAWINGERIEASGGMRL